MSQFVDFFINPLVPRIKSYIRDSTHIINILNEIIKQPLHPVLCTLVVSSLHTNRPHEEGIKTIQEALAIHRGPTMMPYNSCIIDLLGIVLGNKYFDFSCRQFHHMAGTAMANLFMSHLEDKYVCTYPLQSFLWKIYIDDIFFIWT